MNTESPPPAGTGAPLCIVLLEDNHADAVLLQAELNLQGLMIPVTVVTSRSAYTLAVQMLSPDLVLADHSLPDMDGWEALRVAQAELPGVPFVLVTGTLGHEAGSAFLRAGATDYVHKDQLARLGPLIRKLRESKSREAAWREADAARRAGEAHLREWGRAYGPLLSVLDDTPDIVGMTRRDGKLRYLNRAGRRLLGLDPAGDLPALTLAALQPRWALTTLEQEGFPVAARLGTWTGDTAVRTPAGEEVAARQTLLAFRGSAGEVQEFSFRLWLLEVGRPSAWGEVPAIG